MKDPKEALFEEQSKRYTTYRPKFIEFLLLTKRKIDEKVFEKELALSK
jgi:hypothetical protein